MSKIPSFLRFFYEKQPHRCLLLGVSGSGKSTLLYRIVLGSTVQTIPTIGFNCEEAHVGRETICFWDVGGCDKIRPLIRHYMHAGNSILFLIDTNWCVTDTEGLEYTLEELVYQCKAAASIEQGGEIFVGVALVKQDLLQEGSGVLDDLVAKVKMAMEGVFPGELGRRYDVYTNEVGGGISAVTGKGVDDGWLVRELLAGIKRSAKCKVNSDRAGSEIAITSPPLNTLKEKPDGNQLRALIEKQNKEDPYTSLTPAEFLEKMESGALERWDHRAHLRAGFYVLLEHLWVGQGLWEAAEDFLAKLERMLLNDIKQAEIEKREKRFRNTVHRTMTTFYLHSIHTAILTFMDNQGSSHILPKHKQFNEFLLLSPHLMDSSLWSAYYTKQTMFSPAAKSSWRLPDLKPLPDYTRSVNAPTAPSNQTDSGRRDSETERLQRFAFAILKHVKETGQRRGKVIKESLGALQKHIMSQRANGVSLEPYSETKAYFWIQILHAGVESLSGGAEKKGIEITALSFESFVLLFPDLMRHRDKGKELWRTYYTEKSWESMEARMGLVFPTLKQLPNIIVPPTKSEREAAVAREMEIRSAIQNGSFKKLTETEVMLYEFWVVCELRETLKLTDTPASTHGELLLLIFSALWKAKLTSASMGVASTELVAADLKSGGVRLLGATEKVFWVQVILQRFLGFSFVPVANAASGDHGEVNEEIKLREFHVFLGQNRELSLNDLWRGYYSEETWNSEDARARFIPPDLKEMEKFV